MAATQWNDAVTSRDEQRRQKRQAVLSAGAKLFNDQGFERTSLDDIAAELNVTKRTIYYYVQSKEEILFECLKLGMEFIEQVTEELNKSGLPPLERLDEMVRRYGSWVATDIGACLALTNVSSLSEDRATELRESKRELNNKMRAMIEDGIADGSVNPCDPFIVTAAIYGALNWIPKWNRRDRQLSHEEISVAFLQLFMNGLRRSPAADRAD
ncbi:MAG: TetR/AcrR family transcriptional regulator [Gammaproteobacteria bacterium]|uniref:TetR/AcrR family transcriptional regulator n=1 Tax=Roseovarius sp. TaxID=1486281 RepID=UPI001C958D2B|nr:TetR/AcrR family transcriptional regulator [uncultured Roseovarius sp.]MBY5974602.1 TetR/AcrR family transcriptional regulator [Ferrimonas balearica]|tara:strand:- start:34 stop:669 length:636 start_codon:yes stop_codon:yes gene_type:complete